MSTAPVLTVSAWPNAPRRSPRFRVDILRSNLYGTRMSRCLIWLVECPSKRARHVITEDNRVLQFADAARRGDRSRMGELFLGSHVSMQRDYEISCAEIDFLVETAASMPGVFGARMTGGGFGGCTVNLLDPSYVEQFKQRITTAYSNT